MNRLRRTIWTCAALGGVTLATFWPVLHNDFIGLDDKDYVVYNPRVTGGLTWQNAAWAFRTGFRGNWHPLTWLSHMLDAQCFGLAPAGHHLTSLLLHTANALLLFLLLQRLTDAHWRSAFVAALFALHPLRVESVAWVAERKDVLSTFFFLLALHAYVRYVQVREGRTAWEAAGHCPHTPRARVSSRPPFWYGVTLGLFVLGLMSKAMVMTLPCVLLLLDYWPLRRMQTKSAQSKANRFLPLLAEKLPFFVLALGAGIVALLAQTNAHAVAFRLPLASRLANATASYWKYLGKMIWPVDLAVFYPLPKALYTAAHPCLNWRFAVGAFALAALSLAVVLRRRRQPWLGVGWFWYLGTLVPVIGLIQVGGQAMADRYTYIPLIGIFLCIAWGAAALATRFWPAPGSTGIPAGALLEVGEWQRKHNAPAGMPALPGTGSRCGLHGSRETRHSGSASGVDGRGAVGSGRLRPPDPHAGELLARQPDIGRAHPGGGARQRPGPLFGGGGAGTPGQF